MDNPQPSNPQGQNKLDDDYQAASQAAGEYDNYNKRASTYTASRHLVRKMLIVLGVLVLLAAIGFGIYWLFFREDDKKPTNTDTSQNSSQQQNESENNAEISTKTEH